MAHTPGPWKVERDDKGRPASVGHGHILIASLSGRMPESNAKLIASAPELLDVAEGVFEMAENGEFASITSEYFWSTLIPKLRQAIEKATGA